MKEMFLLVQILFFNEAGALDTGDMVFGPFESKAQCEQVAENWDLIERNVQFYTGGMGSMLNIGGCYTEDELFEE